MLGNILGGQAFAATRAALGGLARRQEAIASNIANVDTPGYQRRSVDFETALRDRLQDAGPASLVQTDARHLRRTGPGTSSGVSSRDVVSSRNDNNTVSVDEEMAMLSETQLRYQALTQSLGTRIGTLRSVIRGQ